MVHWHTEEYRLLAVHKKYAKASMFQVQKIAPIRKENLRWDRDPRKKFQENRLNFSEEGDDGLSKSS
jgi:hypothetical protein